MRLGHRRAQPHGVRSEPAVIAWGHPLAHGLARAYLFAGQSNGSGAAPGTIFDLTVGYPVLYPGATNAHLDGEVMRCTGSNTTETDRPDLTPATGQGSGGLSVVAGIYKATAAVADHICGKYETSNLEYDFGFTSTLLLAWMYDNTASTYSGRQVSTPASIAGRWANVAFTWNGGVLPKDNLKIWIDATRVDTADFDGGGFVQVRDTGAQLKIGGNDGGTGVTTDLRFRYLYLFRRGLLPDEIAWLNEDPYCFLTLPTLPAFGPGAAAPGGSASGFFFGA